MADRPPYEIARETLKQLATRRLAPTPDNYLAIYDEIAGSRSFQPFPDAQLSSIQRVLPAQTPGQKRLLTQFEKAIATKDWSALQSVLVGYANLGLSPVAATPVVSETTAVQILPADFAEALARLIDNTLPALGEEDARVHDMATQLITFLREPDPPPLLLLIGYRSEDADTSEMLRKLPAPAAARAGGERPDRVEFGRLVGARPVDEAVRQPVSDDVERRVPQQLVLQDVPHPVATVEQQLRRHQRVDHAGVPAQHDQGAVRRGSPELVGALDVEVEPEHSPSDAEDRVDPRRLEGRVRRLRPGTVDAAAEAGRDPQYGGSDHGDRLPAEIPHPEDGESRAGKDRLAVDQIEGREEGERRREERGDDHESGDRCRDGDGSPTQRLPESGTRSVDQGQRRACRHHVGLPPPSEGCPPPLAGFLPTLRVQATAVRGIEKI